MTSGQRKTLRFGVGTSKEYWSAIWRLWVQGNDVYLAPRDMARIIKFSLHRSGIWRLAYTTASGIRAEGSADRLEKKWSRPPEFRAGWTRGPGLIVPDASIRKPFSRKPEDEEADVLWSPTLQPGHRYFFMLFFLASRVPEGGWQAHLDSSGAMLGVLDLRNGERVMLCRTEGPLVEKQKAFIEKHKGETWIDYPNNVPELVEGSMFFPGTDDDGFPIAFEIPFGWENVRGPWHRAAGI